MNDKQIRSILISYLQTKDKPVRIYSEKAIGNSICDILAVTDKLTGYEIKADNDDYRRLPAQTRSYDRFCDENYVVVGRSHVQSVQIRVPEHWGIICIDEGSVSVIREASKNNKVSAKAGLSLLWKIELKNILIKHDMPTFAQQNKAYLINQLIKRIDESELRADVAYELFNRDYTVFDNAEEDDISEDSDIPQRELIDMLSENDLESFTLAKWIDLYGAARELQKAKEKIAVKKSKERKAIHEIHYSEIEAYLGAPWISEWIIDEFIGFMRGKFQSGMCIHEPITSNWYIEDKQRVRSTDVEMTVTYGTRRYNALYILEAALNLREIKLNDSNGRYDEAETLAALEKLRYMRQVFSEWVWQDEDRCYDIEAEYNRLFAQFGKIDYDGRELSFDDMSPSVELYPYQKDAVKRIIDSKNTLLAFDVGAGKTYIMITAAMEMRKSGLSRRNMFVVPNHIVGQWEKIFCDMYPKAKVLAIEPKEFKPELRQKVLKQIKEGDYDGIIIAYSCFEMIPVSEAAVYANLQSKLSMLEETCKNKYAERTYDMLRRKDMLNKEISNLMKQAQSFINAADCNCGGITFDELEISTLFLDEAHNYKNLPLDTRLRNLSGFNVKGSDKCYDMLMKVRTVQNSQNGKGAVFATGTPLCNSIADAYVMQIYLQYDVMCEMHLDKFDNWVRTFALPEQRLEIDVNASKYRMITRFVRFFNLPELSRMFSQIATFYTVAGDESLPFFEGYTDVPIRAGAEFKAYMCSLCERTDRIRERQVDRSVDNMLKVTIDGRKAALDLSLVGEYQPYDESSKTKNCIDRVMRIYRDYPGTTQLIFCDYSTPKGDDFSVYAELKRHLTEEGVPKKEIAFIHSYNTDAKKAELYRKFNAGEIRILIGSTFKLGIGANVQTKLRAVHHLDVPWRPADMVQREGRIIRRGNENESVDIYRYITEGSFDAYSWQILETKQRFISQFLAGSSYARSVSDLEDNVLSYADVKALAISEPLMKEYAEAENRVKSLSVLVLKQRDNAKGYENELSEYTSELSLLQTRKIPAAQATYKKLCEYSAKDIKADLTDLGDKLSIKALRESRTTSILFFEACLSEPDEKGRIFICLTDEGETYRVEAGESARGNARRLYNFFAAFEKQLQKLTERADELSAKISDLRTILADYDDTYEQQLREAETEKERLKKLIMEKQTK